MHYPVSAFLNAGVTDMNYHNWVLQLSTLKWQVVMLERRPWWGTRLDHWVTAINEANPDNNSVFRKSFTPLNSETAIAMGALNSAME